VRACQALTPRPRVVVLRGAGRRGVRAWTPIQHRYGRAECRRHKWGLLPTPVLHSGSAAGADDPSVVRQCNSRRPSLDTCAYIQHTAALYFTMSTFRGSADLRASPSNANCCQSPGHTRSLLQLALDGTSHLQLWLPATFSLFTRECRLTTFRDTLLVLHTAINAQASLPRISQSLTYNFTYFVKLHEASRSAAESPSNNSAET
jgi:hypothetical protein